MLCVIPGLMAAALLTAGSPTQSSWPGTRRTDRFPAEAGTHRSAAHAPASMGPGLRRDLILKLSSESFRFRFGRECGEQVELARQARRHPHGAVAIGDLGQHA